MDLNAYIIRDYLHDRVADSALHSDMLDRDISGIAFYHTSEPVRQNLITIITLSDFLVAGDSLPRGTYLCTGWIDDGRAPAGSDVIFLNGPDAVENPFATITADDTEMIGAADHPSSITMTDDLLAVDEAYELLRALFARFDAWERKLFELVVSDVPLRELGDCSLDFLDNPIGLYTASQRNIFGCERQKDPRFQLFRQQDLENYLSDAEIDELRLDPEFIESVNAVEPTIFSEDMWGYRILFYNIRLSGTYVARLLTCEVERPLRDSDHPLLEYLADFMKMALQRQNIIMNEHPLKFDSSITRLLERQLIDEDQLALGLSLLDWKPDDTFFCMVISTVTFDQTIHSVMDICSRLEVNMPSSAAMPLEDFILLIADLSAGEISRDEYLSKLGIILRESLLNAGASREFDDINLLADFHDQARTAFEIGNVHDPMFWCYRYENYALSDLIRRAGNGITAQALLPTGLRRLMDHDAQHGRDLTRTLRTYLENNCSPTQTTRALYMQRATFVYQLKRIKEITGFDLDKPDTRLLLLNVFAIMDT